MFFQHFQLVSNAVTLYESIALKFELVHKEMENIIQ